MKSINADYLGELVAASSVPCSSPQPGLCSHVSLHETRSGMVTWSAANLSAGSSDTPQGLRAADLEEHLLLVRLEKSSHRRQCGILLLN